MIAGMHYMGLLYNKKMYCSKNDFVDAISVVVEINPLASYLQGMHLPLSYIPNTGGILEYGLYEFLICNQEF